MWKHVCLTASLMIKIKINLRKKFVITHINETGIGEVCQMKLSNWCCEPCTWSGQGSSLCLSQDRAWESISFPPAQSRAKSDRGLRSLSHGTCRTRLMGKAVPSGAPKQSFKAQRQLPWELMLCLCQVQSTAHCRKGLLHLSSTCTGQRLV